MKNDTEQAAVIDPKHDWVPSDHLVCPECRGPIVVRQWGGPSAACNSCELAWPAARVPETSPWTTTTLTLSAFLTARLDEDEAVARATFGHGSWDNASDNGNRVCCGILMVCHAGRSDAAHIARHDPARVLADVESKRRIVAAAGLIGALGDSPDSRTLDRVLRLLALPYADHADYDEEWA